MHLHLDRLLCTFLYCVRQCKFSLLQHFGYCGWIRSWLCAQQNSHLIISSLKFTHSVTEATCHIYFAIQRSCISGHSPLLLISIIGHQICFFFLPSQTFVVKIPFPFSRLLCILTDLQICSTIGTWESWKCKVDKGDNKDDDPLISSLL